MLRAPLQAAVLTSVLVVALAGCLNRTDSLAPVVSITDPRSGATRTTEDLVIAGYALDDEGIAAIRVNGHIHAVTSARSSASEKCRFIGRRDPSAAQPIM